MRAGASFWAHRASMLSGAPAEATKYLSIAAQYPETFYGVMAIKASGQRYEIDFTLPEISTEFRAWLTAQKGGQRAFGPAAGRQLDTGGTRTALSG